MKKRCIRSFALCLAVVGGFIETALSDGDYLLKPPLPMPGATTYSPVAGGFNGAPVYSYDVSDTPIQQTESITAGMIASEAANSSVVGAFIAPPAGFAVDWAKTVAAFADCDAATNGYAFYTALSDASERFVASRCGSFEINWIGTGGTTNTVVYQANAPVSVVPHRLYWTSEGFNGPGVSLPKNYGIKLFGKPSLFWDESKTNAYGAANYDYGVHYNKENSTVSAYASAKNDGSNEFSGPEGFFVVAYYDSGLCEHLIGYTVVEVARPDPINLKSTVGAEVRPQNENYDPESGLYLPVVQSQQNAGSASSRTYFHVQQTVAGQYHKKENRVFAIAETKEDDSGPMAAEICWEAADDFEVYWPFELSCYTITWPDCPTVVIGEESAELGPGVSVPASYSVSVLDWRVPNNVVTSVSDDNVVTPQCAGRFCLKLENEAKDDFWFVPLRCAVCTDETAFPIQSARSYLVGVEVLPQVIRAGETGGRLAELMKTIDATLAGYIYEAGSPGHNWNRNLYHAEGASALGSSGDASFADLASTVYFVNTSSNATDAEIWWMRSYKSLDMPAAVTFPVLPQRYKAVWPGDEGVQDIVIASTEGSATGGYTYGDISLYLRSSQSYGSIDFAMKAAEVDAATFGFWFNARSALNDAIGTQTTTGRIVSVALGGHELGLRLVHADTRSSLFFCELYCGSVATQFQAKADTWLPVFARVSGGRLSASMALGAPFADVGALDASSMIGSGEFTISVGDAAGGAAAGVALDNLFVWNEALPDDFLVVAATNAMAGVCDRAAVRVEFSAATITSRGLVYVQDANSFRSFTGSGFGICAPGAPRWDDGLFDISSGVTPRAYYENDATAWGCNPNEEHAFALANADGRYVLYALRNDMNDADNPPYVFMEYAANGRGAMRVFRVLDKNAYYPWPSFTATAGTKLAKLPPLDRMPSGTCHADTTCAVNPVGDPITHRDRTGALWARRDGTFEQSVYYFGEPSFVCTADTADLSGAVIPFINCDNAYDWTNPKTSTRSMYTKDYLCSTLKPTPIPYTSVWPSGVPSMSIAQVLTMAENGLPEIYNWKTAAVVYPTYIPGSSTQGDASKRVVKLIDPTVARTSTLPVTKDFPGEYGFTVGSTGDCFLRNGKYYFTGLPPVVSDRLYVDINAGGTGNALLTLVGDMHESAASTSYLRVNSLSTNDYNAILHFFEKNGTEDRQGTREKGGLANLKKALDALYDAGDIEPSPQTDCDDSTVTITYQAKDHYALVATGEGSGYVTLIENDGAEAEGQPVSMYVINVGTNLYSGSLVVLTDANNTLSEQLNVLYTAPLGRSADNFYFEWFQTDPPSDGHTPTVPTVASENPTATYAGGDGAWPRDCDSQRSGDGKSCIEAVDPAASTLNELVNRYWTMHYRAKADTPAHETTGGRWSVWCEPTLAEGWVQRVLNAITPFSQRTSDFYNNAADTSMTIPAQIGAPWQGDVALNNENVASVGLMELYRTILNKAESMSVARTDATATDVSSAANKQLILAASRLADFNLILGGEAYADAKNPIVGTPDEDDDETTFSGSVFAFANQVDSLLDEELALLRGRTSATSPTTWTYPCYNRLIWNYTKGMTQGEVAYVNNYNILAAGGENTAETAAAQYPQGHGDAYGYYLSAVTEFYRLLRNPAFTWGEASMMEMLIADKIVNVDYEEEDKFAEAAYRLAKTGVDVVDLTARKQWRDNADDIRSGYFGDATVVNKAGIAQALGYGETACRSGFGALCNWAVANAILPASETNAVRHFTDTSIACVTRQNCASLSPLADTVKALETSVNAVDAGLNPLGLSPNAIPFDISLQAIAGADGLPGTTHYEEIRDRAVQALENCETALDYAQEYGSQLAAIQEAEGAISGDTADMEREYNKQLIAIFGRPFSDDIGAGKLYEQGYDGPDLYHYAYMDLSEYGLDSVDSTDCTISIVTYRVKDDEGNWTAVMPTDVPEGAVVTNTLATVQLNLTSDGLIAKPSDYTGTRASEGSIQAAYRDFLTAYVKTKNNERSYNSTKEVFLWRVESAHAMIEKDTATFVAATNAYAKVKSAYTAKWEAEQLALMFHNLSDEFSTVWNYNTAEEIGIIGLAFSTGKDVTKGILGVVMTALDVGVQTAALVEDSMSVASEAKANIESVNAAIATLEQTYYRNQNDEMEYIVTAGRLAAEAATAYYDSFAELLAAQQTFRTELEEGTQVLAERQLARERAASQAVTARYQDMFARIERNNALSKYSTTFDTAQKYVYQLAKVYDYETGLLSSDSLAGKNFLGKIIGTRALGAADLVTDSSVTDDGLWGILARMDANWTILEGRLGANNADGDAKWHSLRYSQFRIAKDESADANWKEELAKYWCDDIFADSRVARYCQPTPSSAAKVPGLVIPFATTISAGENFFGKTLMGDEEQYSPTAYATRIFAAGVNFVGYDSLVVAGATGLARNPQVYLVPTGTDHMRAPGSLGTVLDFDVVEQVLPLPYEIGSTELDDVDWISTINGLDGSVDSFATIRRHAQFPANGSVTASARLTGRSVWNDGWLLVIPADALNGNLATAKERFLSGAVKDIEIGFKTYTRQGN